MFTVVICSKNLLLSIKNNCSYILDIILNNPNCSICEWDVSAENFEEALPDLKKIIAGKSKWRALILQDEETFGQKYIDKRNPFDVVGSVGLLQDFGELKILDKISDLSESEADQTESASVNAELDDLIAQSAKAIKEYRELKANNYSEAVKNPLTKLGFWLCGIPECVMSEYPAQWPEELKNIDNPIDENYYRILYENNLLASEIEQYHTASIKQKICSQYFATGASVEVEPETILVFSERNKKHSGDVFFTSSEHHEELEYSNFCDDNLYCDVMRFAFFDVGYENNIRRTTDYLAFVSAIPFFAENEISNNVIKVNKVYKIDVVFNENALKDIFKKYLAKLKKTKNILLGAAKRRNDYLNNTEIPYEDSVKVFESEHIVSVEMPKSFEQDEFMATYNTLGLSKDCPVDEYHFWYNQVVKITKKFIRFLREPQRSVKRAIKSDFINNNSIDDERICQLNEFQIDDICYKLAEEEQKMVETTTTNLFNTAGFTERIQAADKEVRKKISQRMTKKKTIVASLICIGTYLIGFLSLIFTNLNKLDSFLVSLALIAATLCVFSICGLVYLFVMKKRLRNVIIHFNLEICGMLNDIDNGLKAFSRYLSHACNAMREFSILNALKFKGDKKLFIINKHIRDIDEIIEKTSRMVSVYDIDASVYDESIYPYDYDFTHVGDFVYDMPYDETPAKVEFLNKGNYVDCVINYIDRITIQREELYD